MGEYLSANRSGDFMALLRARGLWREPEAFAVRPSQPAVQEAHGTTVIALKYREGVLNVGDRRATAANAIMYDRAEKILPLDDYTLIAIAGSYARAMEIVRYLQHSFKYYARTQLQEMSLEGKLAEVSRALAGNLSMALQGIGLFIPVVSAYDLERGEGRIFFYDGMGARFESVEFGAAGSGSERIRGVFDYILKTKGAFHEMTLEEALRECLLLLDIAADLDSATAGIEKVLPIARAVTAEGILDIPEEQLAQMKESLRR
ncbi:MAG: proteasome subunit beta [Armatimonadota bacterium]|nr:MAG: proteasome subunit beta [Armatimonadota bacterium]